jgi:hypothetical protein
MITQSPHIIGNTRKLSVIRVRLCKLAGEMPVYENIARQGEVSSKTGHPEGEPEKAVEKMTDGHLYKQFIISQLRFRMTMSLDFSFNHVMNFTIINFSAN